MMTVGLPVFNHANVLHIALEGLCRQKDAGSWELIVSSEQDETFIIVDKFVDKLADAGCVDIIYLKENDWIPLPRKWQKIGRSMHKDSLGMILQAGDCYSHPDRIKQSRQAMIEGYNWYNESIGYFYYTGKDILVKYDNSHYKAGLKTHLNMCIAAKYAKRLPDSDIRKNIDGWMFNTIKKPKACQVDKAHAGVDLHGINNISKKRGKLIETCEVAFKKTKKTIQTIGLPKEIVKQVKDLEYSMQNQIFEFEL